MHRRQALQRGLVVGTALLAGCSGWNDPNEQEPDEDEETRDTDDAPSDAASGIRRLADRAVGTSGLGAFEAATATESGDFVFVGGRRTSEVAGWVVRTDSDLEIRWQRVFDDRPRECYAVTTAGEDVVAGGWVGTGTDRDGWLVRLGPDGVTRWSRQYAAAGDGRVKSVLDTPEGLVAAGAQDITGSAEGWVVATDDDGTERSQLSFGSDQETLFNAIVTTGADSHVLVGARGSTAATDGYLVGVDGAGERRFERRFDRRENDVLRDAVATGDGVVACGDVGLTGRDSSEDGWLLSVGPDGAERWSLTTDTDAGTRLWGVDVVDGTAVAAGMTKMSDGESFRNYVLRASDGSASASRTIEGEASQGGRPNVLTDIHAVGRAEFVASGGANLDTSGSTAQMDGWLVSLQA